MLANYTEDANDRCFQIADEDIYRIWDTVEGMSEDETAEIWKEKCNMLSREYAFSSRFALMRLLDRKKIYHSPALTKDSADVESMDENDLRECAAVLNRMAASRDKTDERYSAYLIAKALRDVEQASRIAEESAPAGIRKNELNRIKKESKTLLSREDAFQLGHTLGLTLDEMSWFLLRVFDFEDGFRYNSSGDLIEAYVFLTGGLWQDAEALRQAYAEASAGVPKADTSGRKADWTRNAERSLRDMVKLWESTPGKRDSLFLQWLSAQAPYLDLPSRTGTAVYRSLAEYLYHLSAGSLPILPRESFVEEIRNRIEAGPSELDVKDCRMIGAELLENNKNLYTSAPDRAKAWRTVSSDANGLPRLIMAGRPDATRNRVQELLMGEEQAEKGDMLHLLWYGFNLCWDRYPIRNDMFELQCSLADFIETAEYVLDSALLPAFYPPHIMEQSMMLSIISSVEDTGIPAYNYAELCESLIKPRNRKKAGLEENAGLSGEL